MKEPSKEQIKERAKYLKQVLLEKHNVELPHGHALEVISKVFGFKDWNTASALSTKDNVVAEPVIVAEKIKKELPPAAKFLTAGELTEFFASFPPDTKVVVQEYADKGLSHSGTLASICSLTYDSEIQNKSEIRLELNTEVERNLQLNDFGQSRNQSFETTNAGRLQRVVKWLKMQSNFWNKSKPSDYIK